MALLQVRINEDTFTYDKEKYEWKVSLKHGFGLTKKDFERVSKIIQDLEILNYTTLTGDK